MSITKQTNAGEFTVTMSLDLGNITLDSEAVESFYFIEDIFSFCVTGKMVFNDNFGVMEFGPLTGNEKVNIIYGEENDEEWSFNIYKISKINKNRMTQSCTQIIEIFFTDVMFYPLNFLQFSRSWKDSKISDIIDDLSVNFLGIGKWDKKELIKESLDYFYIPYWTINQAISWLLRRSTGSESNQPGFLFYNNSQGTNLITLDTLLNNKKLLSIGDEDDGLYIIDDSNLFYYNKILDWTINGIDTTSMRRLTGSTNLGFNNQTKSFITKETTYKESLEKHTVLGKYSLFPDYSEIRSRFDLLNEDTEDKLNTMFNNEWIKTYDKQHTMSIVVRGHENRYCGKNIEIKWPSSEVISQQYNQNLSGFYLIKSITHWFSGFDTPAYQQRMVLIKNGYDSSDARNLQKSTKNNLAVK